MAKHLKFFKNAFVYSLSRDVSFKVMELHNMMVPFIFTPGGSHDMAKTGWKADDQGVPDIMHSSTDIILTVVREAKNIPFVVLNEAVKAKVAKLEADQGRKLKKTEKDSIKDEVLHQLIPRAFSSRKETQLWIDLKNSRIIVDAGSAKQAEVVLAFLRKTLGSLPVVPLTLENPIELTMTEWLRANTVPNGFTILEEVLLKAILEDGGVVRCSKQDLNSDEISTHIAAGKLATMLALDWQQRVKFLLNDNGSIKRLKFCDELTEQNDDIEDVLARRHADFMLMCDELRTLISDTVAALGGEAKR